MRIRSRLMAAGAQMVKLEGGAVMAESVRFLSDRGVPVWAHIGLTPQSVHALGGYRIQGRAALYIEGIEGSWSGIVGLPIRELYGILRDADYRFPGSGR